MIILMYLVCNKMLLLDKLEFACLLNRMVAELNSDIQAFIYAEYTRTFYDKYTIFELISFLDERGIYIAGLLNKKNILKVISDIAYLIPDKSRADTYNKTRWDLYNLRYMDYSNFPHINYVNKNIICIKNIQGRFEIMSGDTFLIHKKEYKISTIKDNSLLLENSHECIQYDLQEFMNQIDMQSITIIENQLRNNTAKHAHMEKWACMKPVYTI